MTTINDDQLLTASTPCASMRHADASNLVLLVRNSTDAAETARAMALDHLMAMEGTWSFGETPTDGARGVPHMVPVWNVDAHATHAVRVNTGAAAVVARYVLATDVPFLRTDLLAIATHRRSKLRARVAAFRAQHQYRLDGCRLVRVDDARGDTEWSAGVMATTAVMRRPMTSSKTTAPESVVVEGSGVHYVALPDAHIIGASAYTVARTLMDRAADGSTPEDCRVSETRGTVRLSTSQRGQMAAGIALDCAYGTRVDLAARRYMTRATRLLVAGGDDDAARIEQYCALYRRATLEDDIAQRLEQRTHTDLADVFQTLCAMYTDLVTLWRDHVLVTPYFASAYSRLTHVQRHRGMSPFADMDTAAPVRAAVIRFETPDMPVPTPPTRDAVADAARSGVRNAVKRHRLSLSAADIESIAAEVSRKVSRVAMHEKKP